MKKSTKIIIAVIALTLAPIVLLTSSLVFTKTIVNTSKEMLESLVNEENESSKGATVDLYTAEYTEENYKKLKKQFDFVFNVLTTEERLNFAKSMPEIFDAYPQLAPSDGYDTDKCLTDDWYFVSTLLLATQAMNINLESEEVQSFDDFYYLSNSEEGQFELMQKFFLTAKEMDGITDFETTDVTNSQEYPTKK